MTSYFIVMRSIFIENRLSHYIRVIIITLQKHPIILGYSEWKQNNRSGILIVNLIVLKVKPNNWVTMGKSLHYPS